MKKCVLITGACINTGVAIVEKFAAEGYDVIFTGRNVESVAKAEKQYQEKFPDTTIKGYVLRSLTETEDVDETAIIELFDDLDQEKMFVDTLVLNAADQGLGIKIFENPFSQNHKGRNLYA